MEAEVLDREPMEAHPRQCTGTSKQSGERCRRFAKTNMNVCKMHGGDIPAVIKATERRVAREKAEKEAEAFLNFARPIDPWDGLEQSRALQNGLVRKSLNKLIEAESAADGVAERAWEGILAEHIHGLAAQSKLALAAGVEERRIRLDEQSTELLYTAVSMMLDRAATHPDLQLTGPRKDAVIHILADVLHEIEGTTLSE